MNPTYCTIGEFKAHFSDMLNHVRKGGSVIVTYGREKRPVAVLQPLPTRPKRKLGFLADQLKVTIGQDWELTEKEFLGS